MGECNLGLGVPVLDDIRDRADSDNFGAMNKIRKGLFRCCSGECKRERKNSGIAKKEKA
jgi:hypothetical protein